MFNWMRSSAESSTSQTMPKPSLFSTPSELNERAGPIGSILRTYHVNIKLVITTDIENMTQEDLLHILYKWSDEYSGPYLLGKLVKSMMIILIPNLQSGGGGSELKFGTQFDHKVTFTFGKPQSIPIQYLDYNYHDRFSYRSGVVNMSIQSSFTPTSASGVSFQDLYQDIKGQAFYKVNLGGLLIRLKVPISEMEGKLFSFI